MILASPFIELLKRANKTRYSKFLMNNRMIMQCYSVDHDDDNGLHYILHIPETEEYLSEFYDETLILNVPVLLSAYTEGHKVYLEKKRQCKAKPKDCTEELFFKTDKHSASIKFLYYVNNEIITTQTVELGDYPINLHDAMVENVVNTYNNIFNMLTKPNGVGVAFDANRYNLHQASLEDSDVRFFKVKFNGHKVKVPIYKGLFNGLKDSTEFFISLQETRIDSIILFVAQLTSKNITEQQIGYLVEF